MAHLEVERKPPRPWWPWLLLIIVIVVAIVVLYQAYSRDSKSHLRADHSVQPALFTHLI